MFTRRPYRCRHSSGRLWPVGQPDLRGEVLNEDGHQVGHHDDPYEFVAVLGAAGKVGGEVTGVDVGNRGDERRTQQGEHHAATAA